MKAKSVRIKFEAIKGQHANGEHFKRIVLDGNLLDFTACHSCFTNQAPQVFVYSGIKLYDGQFR